MAQSDFEQGFLTALSSFAIKGEGGGSSDGGLPDRSNLRFINCDYFRGSTGEGLAYLSDTRYNSVFSNSFAEIGSKSVERVQIQCQEEQSTEPGDGASQYEEIHRS